MGKYSPTDIYYMITILCNQKCSKCSHWKQKDNAERLPTETFVRAIKSIPTAKELCIVGGEPLLFKSEIFDILNGVCDTEIRTTIITNGVLMDKLFIQNVKNYNIHIVVSIDTMDKRFWQFVRGVNTYDKVIENFEYATNILAPYKISIQSVLSKETQPYLTDVAQYAQSKNIYHSVQDYVSDGFNGSWTELENKRVVVSSSKQQCYAADRNLSIMQNGDVYICFQQNMITDCQKQLGNLNTQNMQTILSHEYVSFVAEKMKICNMPCKVLKCNVK